jgi:hypothetical protein
MRWRGAGHAVGDVVERVIVGFVVLGFATSDL